MPHLVSTSCTEQQPWPLAWCTDPRTFRYSTGNHHQHKHKNTNTCCTTDVSQPPLGSRGQPCYGVASSSQAGCDTTMNTCGGAARAAHMARKSQHLHMHAASYTNIPHASKAHLRKPSSNPTCKQKAHAKAKQQNIHCYSI